MTLLNALLALGAFAFTFPLAIHLFHRSRFKTLDWGAWHLLDSVMRVNRRRIQLANLLLLLLRCLIPILLAFCLARPVLTGFRSLPGDEPRTLVVVVDDSRSMNASAKGEPSRLSLAQAGLTDLMKGLSRRDEVIFLTSNAIDSPPSTMGAATAMQRVKNLTASGGPTNFSSVIDAAISAAQQSSHRQCSVLIVSDFQSSNVTASTLTSLDSLAEQIKTLDPPPSIHFWDLGTGEDDLPNVSVEAVTVDSPAVVAGRNASFSAKIRNASDTPTGELRVVWTIDSVELPPRNISIDERSNATSRLSHRFDEAGVHQVNVSVEYSDSLSQDNRRSIAVDVMRQIDVVLVDGKPSRVPLEGSADWLSIALSPFSFGGDDQPDAVATRVIRDGELDKTLLSERPELVVLANVQSLNSEQQSSLAQFVLQGGALVVFDGDAVRPESFNEPWRTDSASLQLPATLGDIAGTPTNRDKVVASFAELSSQYSPWGILTAQNERPLDDVEIYAYRKLSLKTAAVGETASLENDDRDSNSSRVLLRFSDGAPAVVLAKRGRGQICQFAIPCDNSWTTLPTRLPFLPLMQQMVLDLAGRRNHTTVDVGQPLSVPLSELAFNTEDSLARDGSSGNPSRSAKPLQIRYTIQTPGEQETELAPAKDLPEELRWPDTAVPGAYVFRAASQSKSKTTANDTAAGNRQSTAQTLRIVEVPAQESELRWAGSDRMTAVAERIGASTFSEIGQFKAEDHTRRFGREIWRWILVLLLIAMIGELLLQQNLLGRAFAMGAR